MINFFGLGAKMEELFNTLPRIVEISGDKSLREAMVFAAWRKVTGDLKEKTSPVKLEDRRLLVAVSDKTWKKNLEKISEEIVFRLNAILKQPIVAFIDFQVDKSRFVKEKKKKRVEETLLKAVSPEVSSSANAIEDEDLRHQFLLAVGACLKRMERDEKR
ncbi:MAG: DUF721 domain-containing protein [Pyrinomonadaceae bacterium]|nr:DUF721 domain-containing protein [Pyrinomonadaceae bacterium]MCX7639085.1 DUF721 domain-containing protein [Pyrinomonadaceae bacterium]MDW8303694.1 DciA family protein [Acidobacteriota bacterium]